MVSLIGQLLILIFMNYYSFTTPVQYLSIVIIAIILMISAIIIIIILIIIVI